VNSLLKKHSKNHGDEIQRYCQIVENIHHTIFAADENADIVYGSPSLFQLLDVTPAEINTVNILNILDDDSSSLVKDVLNQKKPRSSASREIIFRKKNGERISTSTSFVPIISSEHEAIGMLFVINGRDDKSRAGLELKEKIELLQKSELATLNIMEDLQETIIDLKRAKEEINSKNEELQAVNKTLNATQEQLAVLNRELEKKVEQRTAEVEILLHQKDEFVNQLGHDLKTPLTPLTTLLPLLKRGEDDPRNREMLDICISNVQFMRNLVSRTLQLAQLNSADTSLTLDDVILFNEVNEVVSRRPPVTANKHVLIDNNITKELLIQADSLAIKEVLDNLIMNAIKYSQPSGDIHIIIDANVEDDQAIVSIKDDGMGMNEEQLRRIFHEFYKADSSRHNLESTGLGLSICKRIIEKHGGRIWASSPGLGKGSTFSFTLPMSKKKEN
jgi:PAS domain S-box-containing protein